jgi:hypothetical protein
MKRALFFLAFLFLPLTTFAQTNLEPATLCDTASHNLGFRVSISSNIEITTCLKL